MAETWRVNPAPKLAPNAVRFSVPRGIWSPTLRASTYWVEVASGFCQIVVMPYPKNEFCSNVLLLVYFCLSGIVFLARIAGSGAIRSFDGLSD